MGIVDKNKALITELHAKAKSRGVKFRNKDLKRLRYAGAKTLSDMFSLTYGFNVTLDEQGELVFSNPIADIVPSKSLFDFIKPDPSWSELYHQPVTFGDKE